jgi:hypothetical protein
MDHQGSKHSDFFLMNTIDPYNHIPNKNKTFLNSKKPSFYNNVHGLHLHYYDVINIPHQRFSFFLMLNTSNPYQPKCCMTTPTTT